MAGPSGSRMSIPIAEVTTSRSRDPTAAATASPVASFIVESESVLARRRRWTTSTLTALPDGSIVRPAAVVVKLPPTDEAVAGSCIWQCQLPRLHQHHRWLQGIDQGQVRDHRRRASDCCNDQTRGGGSINARTAHRVVN